MVGTGFAVTVLDFGVTGATAEILLFDPTTSIPGLMGSDTTIGFVLVAFVHLWPVPFCPSNGRDVVTTIGGRVGVFAVSFTAVGTVVVAVDLMLGATVLDGCNSLLGSSEIDHKRKRSLITSPYLLV